MGRGTPRGWAGFRSGTGIRVDVGDVGVPGRRGARWVACAGAEAGRRIVTGSDLAGGRPDPAFDGICRGGPEIDRGGVALDGTRRGT